METVDPVHHSQLLQRVFDLPGHGLTVDRARWLLDLDFPDEDQHRIDELNARANEGLLTVTERAELEAYVSIGDLLAFWQSEARQYLGQTEPPDHP